MSVKRNIIRVFSANFLTAISSIIVGFIVPAVLSIESYAFVKTYAFYISYIGFMHLGFIDGMYIKYGGKSIKDINKSEFKCEHLIFGIMQLCISSIFIFISIKKNDFIIFLMAVSIIPINTLSFHKLFYQATGEFKKYTQITYISTVLYLIINIVLSIIFRVQNYLYYCLTTLISNLIVYLILEIKFFKNFYSIKIKYSKNIWKNISVGFWILLGNLAVMLFYAIDRWFIKLFFDINSFAYYSFSVSILNIINILVNSVSITFYNYLAKDCKNMTKITNLKKYLIIMGAFASYGYFIFAGIINIFLKRYIPSLSIIAISFSAYPYIFVINSIFVNMYKVSKNEKKYLKVVILMLIISTIYNLIAIVFWKTTKSIAIATTLSFITWYIFSIKDFKLLNFEIRELVFLLLIIFTFLITSHWSSWIYGGIIYLFITCLGSYVILNKEIKELISYIYIRKSKVEDIKNENFI